MAWFDHYRGQIIVKNPDEEILEKMYLIAQAFDLTMYPTSFTRIARAIHRRGRREPA